MAKRTAMGMESVVIFLECEECRFFQGWVIFLIILIVLLCLAGAAAAFWFFYYKRKMGGRDEKKEIESTVNTANTEHDISVETC
ncbi:hypothetical protein GCK72_007556 [Caenorhabditis remanei]|uniref:Uncharacterized protein n=1 Tax=Caenorhabditis remanei TaxID=31234 RepID=A0A6A5HME8_CAERE|nr:hypothetical protein GCK72_007556 [Caenorhabditis remanei]KAF1767597.1 hypothetical protein GCK72_007556 [Caenorhabditis remanei]